MKGQDSGRSQPPPKTSSRRAGKWAGGQAGRRAGGRGGAGWSGLGLLGIRVLMTIKVNIGYNDFQIPLAPIFVRRSSVIKRMYTMKKFFVY